MPRHDPVDHFRVQPSVAALDDVCAVSSASTQPQHDAFFDDVRPAGRAAECTGQPMLPLSPDDLLERHQGFGLEKSSLIVKTRLFINPFHEEIGLLLLPSLQRLDGHRLRGMGLLHQRPIREPIRESGRRVDRDGKGIRHFAVCGNAQTHPPKARTVSA